MTRTTTCHLDPDAVPEQENWGTAIKKPWTVVVALSVTAMVAAALVAGVISLPDPEAVAVSTSGSVSTTSTVPPVTTTTLFKVAGRHKRELADAARLLHKTVPELRRWLGDLWEYGWEIEETATLPSDDYLAVGGLGSTRVHLGRIRSDARAWHVPYRLMLAWVLAHELAHVVDSTERLPIKAEKLFAQRIGNATLVALSNCDARSLDKDGHWLPNRPPCDI